MTATATRVEGRTGARRPPIMHAEDPAHPGRALCGAKLSGRPSSPSGDRCVVCLDLARRTFLGR